MLISPHQRPRSFPAVVSLSGIKTLVAHLFLDCGRLDFLIKQIGSTTGPQGMTTE
ncbi:MAG TPA: hypothetical protein QF887_16295 [SAR324 cluster bacterium]|nr:hypothetical protein [SAR324 cluster bacterium]